MRIISFVVVAALLVFLVIRSRRNPLFLAGSAAFLALGRSIYIDIFPGVAVLGGSSLTLTSGDLLFAAVACGWLYARARRPVARVRLAPVWAGVGILVAWFLAMEFALAWASASELHPTLMLAARDWFYIPLGYFMTLDVLRRFTTGEAEQYIGVLSLFTACASVLYIASAANLPIYPYQKYLVTSLRGGVIVRDFSTFPFWAGLAWCHYLAQPRKNVWTYVALAVVACGVLMTFSRLPIAMLVVTAALATALLLAGRDTRTAAIVAGVVCASLALAVLVVGPVAAPTQFRYLEGRFSGIVRSHSVSYDPDFQYRLQEFEQARAAGAQVDPYLGAGLFDSSANVGGGAYISFDSDWIGIVYRTGWAGIIVLVTPLAVALWRGISRSGRRGSSTAATTLLFTGTLAAIWFLGCSFTSIVYLYWPAVSLLSVALIARAEAIPAAAAVTVFNCSEPHKEPTELLNEISRY